MYSATKKIQQGSALLVLVALILAAMSYVIVKALNSSTEAGRNEANAAVLAQAKQALIGFAATYRDTHADEVFGFLPCPDTNNNGWAEPSCGGTPNAPNISAIGRLPWKTLGLPPLRDSAGECLWYAVSGRAKDNPKTAAFNWDTTGQFRIDDADGATLVAAGTHNTPLAVVFAPGAIIGTQNRTPAGVSECGGNNTVAAYLDGADTIYTAAPAANADSTLILATNNSIQSNTNNDQGQWITSNEIFERVSVRGDFKSDIDYLLGDIQGCLNNLPPAALPNSSPSNKGAGDYPSPPPPPPDPTPNDVLSSCTPTVPQKLNALKNWQDNLLYTKPAALASINGGVAECYAVLFFGGERSSTQTRINADKTDPNMYLENPNNGLFPTGVNYSGASNFSSAVASADLVRCIKGLPAGASQTSFANDFGSFIVAGTGVTPNSTTQTVFITNAGGTSGGCFWLPGTITFAGKTVRSYYEYQFGYADTYAVTGSGTDRGNGITLDIVDGSIGSPTALCGLASNMGAFIESFPTSVGGMWSGKSFTIETDIHRDINPLNTLANPDNTDPTENHTAIMAYGNLAHGTTVGSNGYLTSACNGTAAGCRATPANKFEESLTPTLHNQRIEIHSGCNSTCTTCNPASHVSPNTYVKISTWVDCTDCNDVTADSVTMPTINRCIILTTELNSPYIALTGGFRSGAAIQSVTLSNFILRSE